MFDQRKIGSSFPPFKIEVERCKIHELTLALGDENPIYHDREAAQAECGGYRHGRQRWTAVLAGERQPPAV